VPPKIKGATDIHVGQWKQDLPLSKEAQGKGMTVAEDRRAGDPAFLSITLGDARSSIIYEVRDLSSKLSTIEHVLLLDGLTWTDTKGMCIQNHDRHESCRAADYNRTCGREKARELFLKFADQGTGGLPLSIPEEDLPTQVLKPRLARDVYCEALIDMQETTEASLKKLQSPITQRATMDKLREKRKRKQAARNKPKLLRIKLQAL
jgi:hypothetical protein